jgi:hypothetical protein
MPLSVRTATTSKPDYLTPNSSPVEFSYLIPETAMLAIVDNNTKKLCAHFIDNKLLLAVGVEHLLPAEADLCVIGSTAPGGATLLETVNYLQPEIVILDQIYFLTLPLNLFVELLDSYPQIQVIVVSAIDDRVQVYYKLQVRVIHLADLFHLLRGRKKKVITGCTILLSTIPARPSRPVVQPVRFD